jgi:hypothetical protein
LDGTNQINTAKAQTCQTTDLVTAYALIKAMSCPFKNRNNEMGGQILTAGVYCDAGGPMILSTDLTLNGSATDTWFFQANSSLVTSMRSKMILTGGAISENVFWAVRKDVILGNSSSFFGTLISSSNISVGKTAVIYGQILSAFSVFFDGGSFIMNANARILN